MEQRGFWSRVLKILDRALGVIMAIVMFIWGIAAVIPLMVLAIIMALVMCRDDKYTKANILVSVMCVIAASIGLIWMSLTRGYILGAWKCIQDIDEEMEEEFDEEFNKWTNEIVEYL